MERISSWWSRRLTATKVGDAFFFPYQKPELILQVVIDYNDDTFIIPRSTTVIVKRLPALRPGRGGAARYVSGKMPMNAPISNRPEPTYSKSNRRVGSPKNTSALNITDLQTEEERIAAVLKIGADHWEKQQEAMAQYV